MNIANLGKMKKKKNKIKFIYLNFTRNDYK